MEQKIKQDEIKIGENIRQLRKSKKIGQTEFARLLQLEGIAITRETVVKIERGIQHIKASQLVAMKKVLNSSFDELFK